MNSPIEQQPRIAEVHPRQLGRVLLWIAQSVLVFVAVAITNGWIVFFLGATASFLFSAWMLTPFVRKGFDVAQQTPRLKKWGFAALGGVVGLSLAYGNPIYLGTAIAVLCYELKVLDQHGLSAGRAFWSSLISAVPVAQISHASYASLTLSSITYRYEAIIGFVLVVLLLLVSVALLVKDGSKLP